MEEKDISEKKLRLIGDLRKEEHTDKVELLIMNFLVRMTFFGMGGLLILAIIEIFK